MNRPTFQVADIIRAQGSRFLEHNRCWLSFQQTRVLAAIARCRTAALGGHIDTCSGCGHQAISYNSCRDWHCPKCQAQARQRWLSARERELMAVPYFHVVFTLPHELNRFASTTSGSSMTHCFAVVPPSDLDFGLIEPASVLGRVVDGEAPRLSAALAFYTILSLAPLAVLVSQIVNSVGGRSVSIVNEVGNVIGPDGANAVREMLEATKRPSSGTSASVMSVITLLF